MASAILWEDSHLSFSIQKIYKPQRLLIKNEMENYMKNKIAVFVILFFTLLSFSLESCATSGTAMQSYLPTFSWSPQDNAPANSANMTIAIVAPLYGTGQVWALQQAFGGFSNSLNAGFQHLLTSKGFMIQGPYSSYDAMTFQDKKASELAIYPSLGVTVEFSNVIWHEDLGSVLLASSNSSYQYQLEGDIVIGGKVTLIALEPMTNQKMWVKDIVLPDTTIHVNSQKEYLGFGKGEPSVQLVGAEVPRNFLTDAGIEAPVAKALEIYFDKILNTASQYIDVEEMHNLQNQVKEIRGKAQFINH